MLVDLKIAYPFPVDASEATGIPQVTLKKDADSGEIETFTVGNRTYATRAALEQYCYRRERESRHERSGHG